MDANFEVAAAASVLAAAVTTAGIVVIRRFERWARSNTTYFASFAAGVLVSVSLLHILPKSFSMITHAGFYVLGGYLAMLFFNRFLTAYVCDHPARSQYAIGLVPLGGIAFHSFVDGIVYSISFSVSTYTGTLVALGMVLHEFPEGIVTYALLLRGGFSGRWAFALAFAAAGLTTPAGTLASFPFISRIEGPGLGRLLAVSAGALLYVGATHLLPQAEREPRRFSLLVLAAGIAVAIGIVVAAP
jgi:zinc and cadmium transporter